VVAVNGQPLQSAQAVQRLFGDVMSRGEVAITVRRNGRETTLRPDLEQIMGSLQSQ
jgi:type II secretory pathway component PulC